MRIRTELPFSVRAAVAVEDVEEKSTFRIDGAVTGRLLGLRETGEPVVDFPGNPSEAGMTARSIVVLQEPQIGCEVLLAFEGGDAEKPIITGILQRYPVEPKRVVKVRADQESIVLKADREIVLECGRASITLTRAGKILIRGAYVLSRSSGANRIKGGSVQIN